MEEQFTSVFSSFSWQREPYAEKLGSNNYLRFATNYELTGMVTENWNSRE